MKAAICSRGVFMTYQMSMIDNLWKKIVSLYPLITFAK